MMLFFFNLNLFLILIVCHIVYSSDMDYIPDDWVDPTDMRNYDRFNKKMKSSSLKRENKLIAETNDDNSTDQVEDLRRFEIFVERFINRVLSTANLMNKVTKPNTRIVTEIPVMITSEELSRLMELSEKINASKLIELDELISSFLTHDRGFSFDSLTPYLNPVQQLFFNLSYEKITVLVFIMVFCVVMWMFAVGRELKKIIIFLYLIFFMSGLGWNWWKMYQEAVIEQFTEMQRLSQIPDVCVPKKIGFFEYIFSSSSASKNCHEYHKAFQFDPFSKVPPTIVLSETVSGMLVYPLKALGSSVGEFLVGINGAAPWPLKIIFLPFIFLVSAGSLICIIIVCLGVKLNLWTLFGGVSIGGRIQKETPMYPTVTDEMSLRQTIEYESENRYVITQVGTIRKCLTAVQKEVPIISPNENQNFSKSAINRRFCFPQILKIPASSGETSDFASGDKLLCDSDDTVKHIQDHWNNVLRLLNCNTKRKIHTTKILNQRSVIHKKKYN